MTPSWRTAWPPTSTTCATATSLCPCLTVGSRHQEVTHLERVVGERQELQVGRRDVALAQHPLAHPVDEPSPVVRADQDHRELGDLAGLDERERLPELVHRAEAAGEDHEAAGVADEHDLAR